MGYSPFAPTSHSLVASTHPPLLRNDGERHEERSRKRVPCRITEKASKFIHARNLLTSTNVEKGHSDPRRPLSSMGRVGGSYGSAEGSAASAESLEDPMSARGPGATDSKAPA